MCDGVSGFSDSGYLDVVTLHVAFNGFPFGKTVDALCVKCADVNRGGVFAPWMLSFGSRERDTPFLPPHAGGVLAGGSVWEGRACGPGAGGVAAMVSTDRPAGESLFRCSLHRSGQFGLWAPEPSCGVPGDVTCRMCRLPCGVIVRVSGSGCIGCVGLRRPVAAADPWRRSAAVSVIVVGWVVM